MPELPEIRALASDLRRRAGGRVLEPLEVVEFAALKSVGVSPGSLVGCEVGDVGWHGKFLDVSVGPAHLVIHLARAGWLTWRDTVPDTRAKPGKGPLAARLVLGDGCLDVTEAGTRKNLALHVVDDPSEVRGVAVLGADPLGEDFTEEAFARILEEAGRSQIKRALRDQTLIAGVGNAYSDEILHRARMSPFAPAAMPAEDARRLYDALVVTLRSAVDGLTGLPASEIKQAKKDAMLVHGQAGEPCPVCGDTVREVVYADSSLQYCPTCQTGGRTLADRGMLRLLR